MTAPVPRPAEEPDREALAPLAVADAEALRDHLDALNDAGEDCTTVGIDSRGIAFLAVLAGGYAETVAVVLGNPWDSEVDFGTGTRCDDCRAAENADLDRLNYPVTVLPLLPTPPAPGGGDTDLLAVDDDTLPCDECGEADR